MMKQLKTGKWQEDIIRLVIGSKSGLLRQTTWHAKKKSGLSFPCQIVDEVYPRCSSGSITDCQMDIGWHPEHGSEG